MSAQCLRVSTRCPVLIEASITLETYAEAAAGETSKQSCFGLCE